jgi:hypothetical protein
VNDWIELAKELEKQGTAEEYKLARRIRLFVENMPEVETRHEALKRELKNNGKDHQRG